MESGCIFQDNVVPIYKVVVINMFRLQKHGNDDRTVDLVELS
ncbi:hypothetical protein D3OALGA1CA_5644 [Olavius algarvensis associated proteobacterium Delta 3]|nr:hypothetical protein D3OALGB2SA_4420 [Olavius algarvensis associated proteobacterium Delta 3]CAB5169453.1 hypothetical protein D3OALGA1CA_5644 [Olavius algarvensis associated proteobacterium Delta 3]